MMMPADLSGFGPVRVLCPLSGGVRNNVWKVEMDGQYYVAKSTRRTEAQVRWMADLMAIARHSGLRTPVLQRAESGTYTSGGYTLETYLPGRMCPKDAMPDISHALSAFHTAGSNLAQRPGFASCADLLTQDQGGDVDMTALPPDLRDRIRTAFVAIADEPVSALHGDLGEINLLIEDGQPPALIDWDECRVDCACFDLQRLPGVKLTETQTRACLAFEIATCWQSEPDYSKNLARSLTQICENAA